MRKDSVECFLNPFYLAGACPGKRFDQATNNLQQVSEPTPIIYTLPYFTDSHVIYRIKIVSTLMKN